MNIVDISKAFIFVVDELTAPRDDGKRLYVQNGSLLYFSPNDYKKALRKYIASTLQEDTSENEILKYFRGLQYIICDAGGRFTRTQKIDGRTKRVITADGVKYEILKEVIE